MECRARRSEVNDDRDLQNLRPATKTATHLVKTSQKYCACHTKRLSTRYQTGCNVTKRRACHGKRHDSLLGNRRKGEILQLPRIDTTKPQSNQRLENRRFLTSFLMKLQNCYLKINVSCKASVNFQHISQNAMPVTEFAPCRHLTQP